jgi:hypothetical protein
VRADVNDEVASAAGFVAKVLGMDVVCFFASALLPSLFLEHTLFLVLPGSRLQGGPGAGSVHRRWALFIPGPACATVCQRNADRLGWAHASLAA